MIRALLTLLWNLLPVWPHPLNIDEEQYDD